MVHEASIPAEIIKVDKNKALGRGQAIIALFKRDLWNIFKIIYNKSYSIHPIEFDFGRMEDTLT
jgi:hypothetical protein